jgi:putative transposase
VSDPIPQKSRAYRSRIDTTTQAQIAEKITAGWQQGNSVDYTFATTWDQGIMLACRRSWWRIAATIEDQTLRPVVPTKRANPSHQQHAAPVLKATGPGQVWSWDITDLRSPWRNIAFKAYSIIDIFSRKLVGTRVENREVDQWAVEMFEQAITEHGQPQTVHADSGPAMRSTLMKDFLHDLGIDESHNRPRVSNDNAFSESEFRTMKYRPKYPKTFTDIDEAKTYVAEYVPWYNQHHKHSGIALFSPNEVHDGSWVALWHQRDHTLQAYYAAHPERFHHRPTTPAPAGIVGINLPENPENQTKRLQPG